METKIYNHKVKFKVSLNNGETFYEGKGDYVEIAGQLSPWQRLLKYTVDNKVEITSLSLYTDSGQTFNLPSSGKNPKFKPFRDIQKPIDYDLKRYVARELDTTRINGDLTLDNIAVSEWFTVIEAIYPDYKLELWVDEFNIQNCWTLCTANN
jgi:hypothetical protein